ncbi:MAG: hypothetical protein JOZ57_10455 [Abitibacteriaceae bacterium]|nr:hypothetical protein [Abditibacteriaceae bacterium]
MMTSPNGRYSTSVVRVAGWRVSLDDKYSVYVTDNQTGESILATEVPWFCAFNAIALKGIQWDKHSQRFTCYWEIEDLGVQKQYFKIESKPRRIKSSPPCCSSE